jgi:xanthine dehydrogenase molybdopterin-binding subunit B
VGDEAQKRAMLDIWPVCAPHARARILHRDATRALAMPGVVAVLFAEDIPGQNDVGAIRKDEVLLADQEVSFHGQPVGVVVATTRAQARAAAAAVEVTYESLPALLTIEQAMAAGSYHSEPHRIRRGDVERALAQSPKTLQGVVTMGGQEHFYLETHAAWAEWGDGGEVRVVSSTQHPSEIQNVVAHVLHLPRAQVVVEAPRMGGGFGRQGDPGQRVGGVGGAGGLEDAAAGAGAARQRRGYSAHRQASSVSRRVRGGLRCVRHRLGAAGESRLQRWLGVGSVGVYL